MILSLVAAATAAATATAKWLVVAKVATTVGTTCVALQPMVDAYQERRD